MEFKPRVFETCVSCSGCGLSTCDPHALGGAQCGEQRRPTESTSNTQTDPHECIFDVERIVVDVPVPQVHVPMPQVAEEVVGVVQIIPERIMKHVILEVPLPQISEEIRCSQESRGERGYPCGNRGR